MTVEEIAACLANGGVVLLPTDTVYGLAVSPTHEKSIDRLFALKRRPRTVNLPIMVASDAELEMCRGSKTAKSPKFQTAPNKDDKLFLIARPHGDKVVSHGSFYGNYMLGTQEYWSVKIDSRDGFSGSPVYNSDAEVVGIFSGYDWSQKLALISPSIRAQKLLADYNEESSSTNAKTP